MSGFGNLYDDLFGPEKRTISDPKKDMQAIDSPAEKSAEAEPTLEELLAELDGLVGLDAVKKEVHSLINYMKVQALRQKRGMKTKALSRHLVFTGNPGTGKTTVARLIGKLYHSIGVLSKGQLVEVDRSGLVAGYLGQTAIKAKEVAASSYGGVLFIDEAYSLTESSEDSYGQEAVNTILKEMEDHRDELVVIVAGYTQPMKRFINSNPGLKSRFNHYIHFPDYTPDELAAIMKRFCKSSSYVLSEDVEKPLLERMKVLYACRDEHCGNARDVRNLFEKMVSAHADRISVLDEPTDEELSVLTADDLARACTNLNG